MAKFLIAPVVGFLAILIWLGNILLRKQDAAGALREFKESLRLAPNGPLAEPTRQVVSKIEAALKSSQQQTPIK